MNTETLKLIENSLAQIGVNLPLSSENNDSSSLKDAYSHLMMITESNVDFAEEVLFVLTSGLQSDKNSGDLLKRAYSNLGTIVDMRPELAEKVLDAVIIGLRSDKNDEDSLENAYERLKIIVEIQPELSQQVLDAIKIGLQSGKNNLFSYYTLKAIIVAQPKLAEQVLGAVRKALQPDKNNWCILTDAYSVLRKIAKVQPQLAEPVIDTFKTALLLEENNYDSLSSAYNALGEITKVQPQLAEQVLYTYVIGLQSEKNSGESLRFAYINLGEIAMAQPQQTEHVFDMFKTGLQSGRNDRTSLQSAYRVLGEIAEIQPQLAEQAFETFNIAMQSDKNDAFCFRVACENLRDIVAAQPALAESVFRAVIQGGKEDDKIFVYKSCMKYLSLEESIAKHPEAEQYLRVAHKGRFASDEEFMFALNNINRDTLANSMLFSAQQRVMNVLVSTSAQENGINKEEAEAFRKPDASKEIKDYLENNNDWLIPASFKGAAIFKEYFPAYIKQIQTHNRKNSEDALSIHDAVYWLPEPMSKEANERFAQFIQKNIIYQTVDENGNHKMVHRPLDQLKIIAQNWKALEKKLQNQDENSDLAKLKYNDVLSVCMSVKYEDQRNDNFAAEAAKHGTPEAEYHNCEDIYLAGLKVPEPFDSKKEFTEGKYIGRFLPRDDPRTLFFGDYTDCCQHYGGAGHSCAVSTVKHPFSQLFVIEDDKGKIIAGSWTWENTEGKYREVCFDNIESLGELKSRPEINKIYEQVGEYLTKEENCHKVTVGLGYQDADVSGYKATEAISLPKLYNNGYSDARSQVLLTENPNAKPLDKTQETQRYIRDVCFLDMEAMDRVSEAVFPDSDKQLQAPDNLAGFVIEDREKGVVGYCLYDAQEKSIYDMAVLPEYRTDKNASSKKLFAEMMRTINKEGGEWSAEMRDKTTLKYLEIMAERGLVKFEKHGIDHTMSDGSQVVAVTFEPIRKEVRQATNKLKDKLDENSTAKTVEMKPRTPAQNHGAGIIIDSDAREA